MKKLVIKQVNSSNGDLQFISFVDGSVSLSVDGQIVILDKSYFEYEVIEDDKP